MCACEPECVTSCFSCCPRSVFVVQSTCILVILGLFITAMFGRSLTASVMGVIGIVLSLDTLFSVSRGEVRILKYYALYSLLSTGVYVAIGSTTLSGIDLECAGAEVSAACTSTQVMYGLIMLLGSSAVGIFAAINSALVYMAMSRAPAPKESEDEEKLR